MKSKTFSRILAKGKQHLLCRVKQMVNVTPGVKALCIRLYEIRCSLVYQRQVRKTEIDPHKVVFESYLGRKYSCSPRAIFEELEKNSGADTYKIVWAFEHPEHYGWLCEAFPNVQLVKYRSKEYYRAYAEAGYWVTNYLLSPGIRKRPGQMYVQTWHGTPLKKIGLDVPHRGTGIGQKREDRERDRQYIREGKQVDYMVSPSAFYTEVVRRAFRLGRQCRVLEEGYPRNDSLFQAAEQQKETIRRKLHLPSGKKVILYAPTWRSTQHVAGRGYVYEEGLDVKALEQSVGEQAVLLLRTHYFIQESETEKKSEQEETEGESSKNLRRRFIYDVSSYDEVNDLYLIADLLITDYSSVFFDYANLEKPILFYMYDYEAYREEMKDFYFGVEELPGEVIRTSGDISTQVKALLEEFHPDQKYRDFNEKFNPVRRKCAKAYVDRIWKKESWRERQ